MMSPIKRPTDGTTPVQRSFRLPAATLERLDARARERGQSANTLAARLIEEGLRTEEHPLIYFRDGAASRRPAMLGTRLDVWQVVETLRSHDGSVRETAEYLDQPEVKIRAAVDYYGAHQDEVDAFAARAVEAARREEDAMRRATSIT